MPSRDRASAAFVGRPGYAARDQKYMQSVRPDAPWCPSNIEFIRRINGLDSIEDVHRIVFDASYLVLGLETDIGTVGCLGSVQVFAADEEDVIRRRANERRRQLRCLKGVD